jgi:capsular polysaccharide biosynthesis protein
MNKKIQNTDEINLKVFFRILTKRKLAFFIAFVIVFIIGITYTLLVSPEYSSVSQLTLSNNEIYYNDEFYNYLPDEADSLWIIPRIEHDKVIDYIVGKLDPIDSELKSDALISNAINLLNDKLNRSQLIKSMNITIDRWNGIVTLTTYARTPEIAYKINKTLLNSYIDLKGKEREEAYNSVIKKINSEIIISEELLSGVSSDLEKNKEDILVSKKLEEEYNRYFVLTSIQNSLLDNKGYFIDRIQINKPPDINSVENTSNYLRNILLSFTASVIIGIITAFTVNHFKTP